jgi:putative two-component system response regulator
MTSDHKAVIQDSRILIVDDKTSNILVMQRILQQEGYQNVASTTDPREIIDQLRVFRPDLIVLDLMMPKVDGYAVIVQLRGWNADDEYLPILVVTADASRAAKQKALTLGANDFITKPVDATDVILRVRNLLQTQRLYRQIRHQNRGLMEQVLVARRYLQEAQVEISQLEQEPASAAERISNARAKLAEAVASVEQLVEPLEPLTIPSADSTAEETSMPQ